MVTLNLDWHEVLWWMQGGMAGSHLRWSVYEDMVNRVWPQCSEQERRNLWLIMRRDLGSYWRPDGWSGFDLATAHGEGEWKPLKGYVIDREDADGKPVAYIMDETPWMYFRQVLARFDPENQYAVTMHVHNQKELDGILRDRHMGHLIDWPKLSHVRGVDWESDTTTVTVRTYKWKEEYYINWTRRCDELRITKAERLTIPDDGTM
jgi:hypothetical protein